MDESNETGVLNSEEIIPAQLIPLHIGLLSVEKYVGGRTVDNKQLLQAREQHAGYVVNDKEPSRNLVEDDAKAATMR